MIITLSGERAREIEKALTMWTLNDESGGSADRASLTLDADNLDFLPMSGSEYAITVNGEARGVFQVSGIEEELHPERIIVQLSPAKFNVKDSTGFREPRKKTFPIATVVDVVNAVMTPHGYKVRVDPELANLATPHLNQNEETDAAFIRRLAKKYDAVAKPVNGLYIFGKKGSITTLSGGEKRSVSITPRALLKNTGKIQHPTNVRKKGVKASYRVSDSGVNGEAVVGTEPFQFIKEVFTSEAEATERAEAKLQELNRNGQTFTGKVEGEAGYFAESVLTLDGFKSPRARGQWSIDSVALSGSRTAYTISITATRPKG